MREAEAREAMNISSSFALEEAAEVRHLGSSLSGSREQLQRTDTDEDAAELHYQIQAAEADMPRQILKTKAENDGNRMGRGSQKAQSRRPQVREQRSNQPASKPGKVYSESQHALIVQQLERRRKKNHTNTRAKQSKSRNAELPENRLLTEFEGDGVREYDRNAAIYSSHLQIHQSPSSKI